MDKSLREYRDEARMLGVRLATRALEVQRKRDLVDILTREIATAEFTAAVDARRLRQVDTRILELEEADAIEAARDRDPDDDPEDPAGDEWGEPEEEPDDAARDALLADQREQVARWGREALGRDH